MTEYRKKPIVINAEPFSLGMEDGFKNSIQGLGDGVRGVQKARKPFIATPYGERIVDIGKYMIVTEENGERYPVEVELFNEVYEKIGEHEASHETISSQREEILKLERVIGTMKSEIEYALHSNKTEEIKRQYLKNAVRCADKAIYVD